MARAKRRRLCGTVISGAQQLCGLTPARLKVHDVGTWTWFQVLAWCVVVIGGIEIIAALVTAVGPYFPLIAKRGKHLEKLAAKGAPVFFSPH